MKIARIIAPALAGVALATTAIAVQAKAKKDDHAHHMLMAGPKAEDLVSARQAGMVMSASTLNGIRSAAASGAPLKNLAFPAGGLAKWAASMPALFADSTMHTASRAKPEVFTDKAGFAAKAADFATATAALAAAAKAEDKAAFDAALASAGGACKACHDSYQAPPPAKPAG